MGAAAAPSFAATGVDGPPFSARLMSRPPNASPSATLARAADGSSLTSATGGSAGYRATVDLPAGSTLATPCAPESKPPPPSLLPLPRRRCCSSKQGGLTATRLVAPLRSAGVGSVKGRRRRNEMESRADQRTP